MAGATVVLDLNDRGRVALGERIGPSAARVEGDVTSATDTSYSLRVKSVVYMNGQSNIWSGEALTVSSSLISQATQRTFSRSRTTLLSAGLVAALALLIKSTNLVGNGSASSGGNPPPPGGGT
jgi:hypothetical protein